MCTTTSILSGETIDLEAIAIDGGLQKNVFLAITTKPSKIYKDYKVAQQFKFDDQEFKAFGVNSRWDGTLGFPGGGVDLEDQGNLITALQREVKEEINFDISDRIDELKFISAICYVDSQHKRGIQVLYQLEVDYQELREIQKNAYEAKDFEFELAGYDLYILQNKTIENLKKQEWAGSGRTELDILLQVMGLIPNVNGK